jgi:transposase
MDHLAVDIGGRESQICVRSGSGKILREMRVATRDLPRLFEQTPPSHIVLETCAESFRLADAALLRNHRVRVVPATLAKALGVGARGTKTDRRDARALSEASCRLDELPTVHIPSLPSRARKTMLSMRDALVSSRTALINAVKGWMRTELTRCRRGSPESFPKRIREALKGAIPAYVERNLLALDTLNIQIREADRELEQLAQADSVVRSLMSVPGVGPQTAVAVVATLDDVARFDSAHKVQAYLGLTPGERSSGDSKHRVGITKAGSARVRWLLIQAAWTMRRVAKTHPLALWAADVEKRRGRFVAVVALARKLAGILFAIWRDGTVYDPTIGAAPVATGA